MKKSILSITGLLTILCFQGLGQTLQPDLSMTSTFRASNREFVLSEDGSKGPTVFVNSEEGPGVIWLENIWLSTGSIEFDVKGKDVLQKSFVGLAFHGQNDSTYEAIYFRPFNFNSQEEIRRSHSVQYIFMPEFEWYTLRENYPGKYENPLPQPVNPDDWFHVRISINEEQILVYVNDWVSEVLDVKPINPDSNGKLGFWVGNRSDGTFANLLIQPD
ncbi:hypothetical protein [Jiulongibacter sediminis]|uniref:3-keto-disaccharide hydrolase domain-containing protein n=1 Tax=Jiulongibacter sediminis TaxID=1605367 RepID=A0A0P7BRR3_9BACT|nr:hypothetical protein [Jiulongibacter sediminis]KPM47048.1 hypothetical protein AFM12_17650 [Jiulongibacter sediminis]TBX22391.1 hypothetical protein TK44_17655 [Jiulongibacter sediminis]